MNLIIHTRRKRTRYLLTISPWKWFLNLVPDIFNYQSYFFYSQTFYRSLFLPCHTIPHLKCTSLYQITYIKISHFSCNFDINDPFIVPVVFIAQFIWRLFFMYTNFEACSIKNKEPWYNWENKHRYFTIRLVDSLVKLEARGPHHLPEHDLTMTKIGRK